MRLLTLLSVAVLFFCSYSNAEVSTNNTQSTANLLEPDASRWSGTFGTGYWQGSKQPGPPGSDPNMIPSGSGFIWGGNDNIINTKIAINEATTQEGVQVTGYSYKWKVKNANANIFAKQPGVDNFIITVDVYDAQGDIYETYHYDYSHSHNWTEHSGSETFEDSFLPPSYFSNIVVSASVEPEAFGRVAVEAQSMEKVIIASDIGGSNETVIDKKTGYLFKSGDPNSLSEKILKVLNLDETTLKMVGIAGRKNVVSKFNVEIMCFSTYSEYKKLFN